MTGISRRRLLQLGGGAVVAGLAGGKSLAATPGEMRIGAVLPTQTGLSPIAGQTRYRVAADAARRGLVMAGDDFAKIAAQRGQRLKVYVATAPDADAARRAAARLTAVQGVYSLIGGFGTEQTLALSELAEERQVPFFNIAASSDRLRGEPCRRHTFHVEASAAMYLQALAEWFLHNGYRRYFFVVRDNTEQRAHYQRMRSALAERRRRFGAEEVGHVMVSNDPLYVDTFKQIRQAEPDVVVMMLDAVSQLDYLAQYETSGLTDIPVTGYPSAVAQTRAFYAVSRNVSAHAGSGYRGALWEATLEKGGAGKLNDRFLERWGRPMNPSAWAGYVAVKMLYEAAVFGGTRAGPDMVRYLENPDTVFDVYKGIGASFRAWNHQLRQTLYMVKINPDAQTPRGLAHLVEELPVSRKPGTEPVERLDRIGVPPGQSPCDLG